MIFNFMNNLAFLCKLGESVAFMCRTCVRGWVLSFVDGWELGW